MKEEHGTCDTPLSLEDWRVKLLEESYRRASRRGPGGSAIRARLARLLRDMAAVEASALALLEVYTESHIHDEEG